MIASSSIIEVRVDAPSATIILNRPSSLNALSNISVVKLTEAFEDLRLEKKVRGVILTGAGDAFCSGTDLKELNGAIQEEDSDDRWFEETMAIREMLESIMRFPKPVIAAVNGPALGSGFGLALACDILIGNSRARFGCPEIKRGLVPGVVAPLLAFRLGSSFAARLALVGGDVSCEEAVSAGFCQELVEKDDLLWARANQIVGEMSANSPQAMQMTKTLLNETIGEAFLTNMNLGTANSAAARTTESAKEGVDAFVNKRNPDWK